MCLLRCILLCFPPVRSNIIPKKKKKEKNPKKPTNPKLFSIWRKICTSIFLVAELKVRNALAAPQPLLRPENRTVPNHRGWHNALEFLPLTGRRTGGREPFKHTQSEAVQATSNRWKASAPSPATSYALYILSKCSLKLVRKWPNKLREPPNFPSLD